MIKAALQLAQVDPIWRGDVVDENLGTVDKKDIQDLKNLISIVNPEHFKANQACVLNPTFNEASVLVNGADCDIVIDDKIIEIKTTKKLDLKREYFNQLMGYYILYKIGGISGLPRTHQIKRIGVYFSRYGLLYLINLSEIVNEETFPDFVEWFKERAMQEFGSLNTSFGY